MMVRFKEFLQKQFYITEFEWNIISNYFEEVSLKKKELFIEQGRVCKQAGFILEGVMRYFGYGENGEEQTCYFAAEDDFVIDPFSFPVQTPATTFNLQLVTDCRMAVISYAADKELAKKYPNWPAIANALVQRAMGELVKQKEIIFYDAAGRYGYFMGKYPRFAQTVPLQYIASYLGIAQPSLSRLRKQAATALKTK